MMYNTVEEALGTRRRWTRDVMEHNGAMCILGAVHAVYGPAWTPDAGWDTPAAGVHTKLQESIHALYPSRPVEHPRVDILTFNDDRTITYADVRAVLARAGV